MKQAYTLGDVKTGRVKIDCTQCNRHGDWSTHRLLETYGPDITLPDLKTKLVNCKVRDEAMKNTPCTSVYAEETRAGWLAD